MSSRRTLRLATLLGPNTIDDLRHIAAHLDGRGVETTIVDVRDLHDVGDGVADALVAGAVDVLWACGLLTAELVADGAALDVVAAPVFASETAPVYRSVIVARRGETTGRRLAVNEFGSWSGYRVLFHDAKIRGAKCWHPERMDEIVVTGAHVASASAVVDGRADVAAIDHSVWNWLVTTDPGAVEDLVVVDQTVDCPAPPISFGRTTQGRNRVGLIEALLGFEGPPSLVPASIDDYRFMLS